MNPARFLPILIAVTLATPQGNAQEIKILDIVGNLYSMDVKTAETQFIGSTNPLPFFWSAMAVDSQGRMFAANGRFDAGYDIYQINPNTGQETLVLQTNFFDISSMAFGPGDVLYLINDRDAPWIYSPNDLYTLDLTSGVSTFLGELGVTQVHGLDFRGAELFGYSFDSGLVSISTLSGLATDVNLSASGPHSSSISFCVSDNGALFFVDTYLWMLDAETGIHSLVSPTTPPGLWTGAAFLEGPIDPFALWVGGETDGPMTVHLSGASPNANIAIAWERGGGFAGRTAIPAGFPCAGTLVDLTSGMQLLTVLTANASGEASTPPQFVPAGARRTVHLQAIDLSTCETSNRILIAY